jgi:hypothetical protein
MQQKKPICARSLQEATGSFFDKSVVVQFRRDLALFQPQVCLNANPIGKYPVASKEDMYPPHPPPPYY